MPRPHSTLILLGPPGHGKTSLAAGLRRVSRSDGASPGLAAQPRAQEVPLPRSAAISLALVATELESTRRSYTLLDPGDPHALRKRLIAGPLAGLAAIDGAVLVVDAGLRLGPEYKADLRLLRRAGVAGLVVFLNRAADEDPEFVDLAEHELRVALCEVGLVGDAVPVVRGSLQSLRDGEPAGIEVAHVLYEALDLHVADRGEPGPRCVVAGVLAPDRGETAVACRVLRGGLAPDDRIEIVGITPTRTVQLGPVVEPTPRPDGAPGAVDDHVRCTLRGVTVDDLRVGQVLALPGTFDPHGRFEAEVWFLAPRARAVAEWQIDCLGVVTVGGLARPLRDSAHGYELELTTALALVPGDGFGVVEGGALVGVGVVVAVRGATRKRRRGALSPAGLALVLVDSLNRRDRPDVAAALLLPPDDVLQATVPAFAADMRGHIRSGRLLLRLIDDGRRRSAERDAFAPFDYGRMTRSSEVCEYVGLLADQQPPTELVCGDSRTVYGDFGESERGFRDYRSSARFTLHSVRFEMAVTCADPPRSMLVELSIAQFAVRPGVWYVFGLECPHSWQRL